MISFTIGTGSIKQPSTLPERLWNRFHPGSGNISIFGLLSSFTVIFFEKGLYY